MARDLCVDMRYHWHPDRSFFERRTRDQLAAIAVDCGYAEGAGRLASYKKADLVNSLIRHFDSARAAAEPTPAQREGAGMAAGCHAVSRGRSRCQRRSGRGVRNRPLGGCGLIH